MKTAKNPQKLFFIFFLLVVSLSLFWCVSDTSKISETNNSVETTLIQPERKLDIYWKIVSVEWNEFSILEVDTTKDPTFGMEQIEKRAYMATLSEDQRMAMKERIKSATLWEVKVIIPIGIPISIKTTQGIDATIKLWSLEDMTVWSYVSIRYNTVMIDKKVAEYVKKSFTK